MGEGTRLDLSISYGIIKKHRGTIEVESTPGRGRLFTTLIPVVAQHRTVEQQVQEAYFPQEDYKDVLQDSGR